MGATRESVLLPALPPGGVWPDSPHQNKLATLKLRRREIRNRMLQSAEDHVRTLEDQARGRVKVLFGFSNVEELCERFHSLMQTAENPEADRIVPWSEVPEDRKDILRSVFTILTGAQLTKAELALQATARDQREAIETMWRYGLGTQTMLTDGDGDSLPGVLALPLLDLRSVQEKQRAVLQQGQMGEEVYPPDDVLEYVEEDATAVDAETQDIEPGPVEERVNPALVKIIKQRRQRREESNGNGKGKRK